MADEKKKPPSPLELLGGKKKPAKKKKGPKHKSTSIEHHDDGSHTVRHLPQGGGPETSYAAADLDAVHDGLEKNLGEPNEGEEPEAAPAAGPGPAMMPPGDGGAS